MNVVSFVMIGVVSVSLIAKAAHCEQKPATFYVKQDATQLKIASEGYSSFRVGHSRCVVLPLQSDGSRELVCLDIASHHMVSALAMCNGVDADMSSAIDVGGRSVALLCRK